MRVGLYYEKSGGDFAPLAEQIAAADTLGFDSVWIADRHFEPDCIGSIPIVLAALARRTRAIRLGTFRILALDHPARTAEDFAMIDLLSGGRLNFGVAAGDSEEAFRAYGASFHDREARAREALEMIVTAWTADEFSFGGRYYRFPAHIAAASGVARKRLGEGSYVPQWERGPETPDRLTVTPKPLQEPRPPVWLWAGTSAWLSYAARRGHSVALPPAGLKEIEEASKTYEAALSACGRDRGEVELAVVVDVKLDGKRTAAGTLEELHRVHGATGANHLVWRVPHPEAAHADLKAALAHFAGEVMPMLQA